MACDVEIPLSLPVALVSLHSGAPTYSSAMATAAISIRILFACGIVFIVCFLILLRNTQESEAIHQRKLRTELFGVLNELKQVLNSTWNSHPPKSSSDQLKDTSKAQTNNGRWNLWQEDDWKFTNGTKSTDRSPVLSEYCPEDGERLVGQRPVNVRKIQESLHLLDALSIDSGGHVQFGGWWKPEHCRPRSHVAILIPFRKRDVQLQMFLYHMHPILKRQHVAYRIFVIEQAGDTSWNKGAIYNIGFNTILKIGYFDCFIFHDVDLLLENDKNYYGCKFTPAHLSVAVDTLNYRLPYGALFGGVQVFSKEDYTTINGYSNMYWGWGAEDDDLYTRVVEKGYKIYRPTAGVGRYTMNQLGHFRSDGRNIKNIKMYQDVRSRVQLINVNGLSSVNSLLYNYRVQEELLLTRIIIDMQKHRELKV